MVQAELECGSLPPVYQQQKQGEGFTVYSAKAKAGRNPTTRWLLVVLVVELLVVGAGENIQQ